MPPLPDVSVIIRDGALGLTQPGTGNVSIKFGPSPFGIVNAIYSITDMTTLQNALGRGGPLAEAVALTLAHPTIVDVLRQIIGPDIKSMQSMLFTKGEGRPGQAWHQDEYFIPTRDRSRPSFPRRVQ